MDLYLGHLRIKKKKCKFQIGVRPLSNTKQRTDLGKLVAPFINQPIRYKNTGHPNKGLVYISDTFIYRDETEKHCIYRVSLLFKFPHIV